MGPTGAPGRTTVAGGLAVAASSSGVPTLLIDADVYGGVLASAFGLLDESPGLAGACRMASGGRLDVSELTKTVWAVGHHLRLLTGISRADRWTELRPSAIPSVLGIAREMAPLTIVDCGFSIETDEELSFDSVAPRRNGATLAVLAEADTILVVGSADPAGTERLIRSLAELAEAFPDKKPLVVANRCRPGAASQSEVAAALRRFSGLDLMAALPEDRRATDKAWQGGVSLASVAPKSSLVSGLASIARKIAPVSVVAHGPGENIASMSGEPAVRGHHRRQGTGG